MLKIARRKAPRVTLVQADITSFSVEEDFDAVICPFDTMNHITSLVAWRKVFLNVHQHLRRSGVFVFDINTKAKMESYRDEPKVLLSEDCTTIVEVKKTSEHRYRVLHKVFERERGDRFALHEMQIAEYVPPAATIRRELMRFFKRLIVLDPDRARPSAASEELFFICLGPRDL
jgi:SAM-dependent methyltransferase